MEITPELSAEQLALQEAQARLNQAAENVAKLRKAALDKAAAELAAHRSAEEKKLADQRAELLALEQAHIERKRKQEEAAKAEIAAKKTEEDRLAQEVAKREEEQRVAAVKAAEIKKIQDAARALEIEQQQLEAALRQSAIIPVEDKPQTLSTHVSPLAHIFGTSTLQVAQTRELSAAENAALQAQLDAEKAVQQTTRKSKPEVDWTASQDLEALLRRELKVNPTVQQCDKLASIYNYKPLMDAARHVVEQMKQRPCGMDAVFSLIESTLEAM
jgi:hypothetical protein